MSAELKARDNNELDRTGGYVMELHFNDESDEVWYFGGFRLFRPHWTRESSKAVRFLAIDDAEMVGSGLGLPPSRKLVNSRHIDPVR